MEKGGAETVNVAAKIFGLIVQSFRRDVIRGTPDGATGLRVRLDDSSQAEIADLRHSLLVDQYIGRFDVAMYLPLLISRAQPTRDLDPRSQHVRFGKFFSFRP